MSNLIVATIMQIQRDQKKQGLKATDKESMTLWHCNIEHHILLSNIKLQVSLFDSFKDMNLILNWKMTSNNWKLLLFWIFDNVP